MSVNEEPHFRAPGDWCQTVLESALDAVIGVDSNDRIIDWNHQAELTFGYQKQDVLGKVLAQLIIPPAYRQRHTDGMKRFTQTGKSEILNRRIEVVALHRDGHTFPVELSAIPVFDGKGLLFYSFLRDISEQKRSLAQERAAKNLLAVQYRVMSLLNEAHDIESVTELVLQEIGTTLSWDLALLWTPEDSTEVIQCKKSWISPETPELRAFVSKTCKLSFEKGKSVPGRVWNTGKCLWTDQAQNHPHFVRAQLAELHGLRSGLWTPLRSGVQTLGVLELMRRDSVRVNDDELQAMKALGQHIGQAIERVRINKELSFNVQKYQNFISQSAEGVWRFELDEPVSVHLPEDEQIERFFNDGYLAECNNAMARMYGFESTASLVGLRAHQLLVREDPKNVDYLRAFIQLGYNINEAESVELDRSGQTRVFLNNLVGVVEKGYLVRAWGTQRDVTEQRETSDQLKQSEQKYRHIFGLTPQPLWILDPETLVILDVNEAATEKYGYTREEFLQMTALDLLPSKQCSLANRCGEYQMQDRKPLDGYFTHFRKDGTSMLVEITPSTLILDDKRVRMLLINDVTDKVKNEQDKEQLRQDLERAKNAAEEASRLKSAFLANMSHEIRTPLGAVLGFMDLIFDPETSEEEKGIYQETIRRNGEILTTLIDDILDLSKVEAGHVTTETLNFSVAVLFADIKAALALKAQAKGLRLETEIGSSMPAQVGSDPTRLRQILINLTSNAIKFTESGSVVLKARYKPPNLQFEVSDTGIGISPEQAARLFRPFVQADESMTRRFGGTGLGLVLSRRLAQLLGGDVELKESSPSGSTFRVQIQDRTRLAAKSLMPTLVEGRIERFDGLKVLVVDDSRDNQKLIERLLSRMGAQVELASNGLEAIEKASGGQHDLVLMDIQMPQLDGYSATRRLRKQGYQKPIFALTAHAMSEVRQKSLVVGCNVHLTKPISRDELYRAISEHCLNQP